MSNGSTIRSPASMPWTLHHSWKRYKAWRIRARSVLLRPPTWNERSRLPHLHLKVRYGKEACSARYLPLTTPVKEEGLIR
jgi:hypothetical protein